MKELLLQYAEYNVWANKRMIDAMTGIDENKTDEKVISSFSSVRETVYHVWSAEHVWLQRIQLVAEPVWLMSVFEGTFAEACAEWRKASHSFIGIIQAKSEQELNEIIIYRDRKGNKYETPLYQILHHVFNHSTYHRGQLVTMLRQLGIQTMPGTDFIGFVRER